MKAHVRLKNLVIEVEGSNQKELLKDIAQAQMLFGMADICLCGLCGSAHIRFNYTNISNFEYYGLCCLECSATLNFGQHKNGQTLFVAKDATWRRFDPNGER